MSKTYLVLYQGLTESKDSFKNRMLSLGVSSETAETILKKAPVILKSGMSAEKVKKYATAFREAGAKVTIMEEHGDSEGSSMGNPSIFIPAFSDFTMCPECGMKQPRGKSCERCGYTFIE
jgi:ribosomal protein L7/L12